ncbi:MAG: YraN family protein [Fibrobacteria bacterium]|nr:YraN family protein [Fibrobacteria bacterium]
MHENHKDFGAYGEKKAREYLLARGYYLREKNFRIPHGEIDIIMEDPDGVIVFVEVKSDRTGSAGLPESWVTPKKIRKIQKTAMVYCATNGLNNHDMRFDVVSVIAINNDLNITHIKNAFIPEANNYY